MRYDHRGEGDSAGADDGADQWSSWLRGVAEAATFARSFAPTRAFVLGGLRIGATMAAATAQAIRPEGLMLLAPFASGQAWLRELTLAAAVQSDMPRPEDGLEVEGLRLSAATLDAVKRTNQIANFKDPTWRSAFLASIAPKDTMAKSLGPNLTHVPFHGFSKLFREPHLNEPPIEVFEQATGWLERLADATQATNLATVKERPAAPSVSLSKSQIRGPGWIEETASFGGGLRGVLCLPTRPFGREAVIFGNTAADACAGVSGFATKACRRLAAAGIAALRFDFLGLGESAARNDSRGHIYEVSRLDDFHRAADLLQAHGYDDVALAGVCAGGYHAVHAVLEDERFTRAVAINSWLIWRPGHSLDVPRPLPTRLSAALEKRAWSRLLNGEMDLRRIAAGLALRARQLWTSRRPDTFCRDARSLFAAAAVRGARIGLIYGQGDIAMQYVESDFGRGAAWLRRLRCVRLAVLPGVDHPLYSRASQKLVSDELHKFLESTRKPRRSTSHKKLSRSPEGVL